MKNEVLMPVNQDFLDVFDIFMDEEQKTKIRANNVRQYVEGIVDLLLKDKIKATLKPNELYEGINWGRKIKILKENYDEEIKEDIGNEFLEEDENVQMLVAIKSIVDYKKAVFLDKVIDAYNSGLFK